MRWPNTVAEIVRSFNRNGKPNHALAAIAIICTMICVMMLVTGSRLHL
jgi:hypothetical protein